MATKRKNDSTRAGAQPDDVEAFLQNLEHRSKNEILALRAIIRGVGEGVRESIKWNAPSFSTSEHFATFNLRHKEGVQVVLHLGVKPRPDAQVRNELADPLSLLEWRSADRATVTFRNLQEIEDKRLAFVDVLRQWITFV